MRFQHVLALAGTTCLTAGLAAAQDECVTALAVGQGATAFDTTTGTPSIEPWSCAASTGPDLWFTYTAAASTALNVDLCGSAYDTALTLYDGACGALNELGCNDDFCGLASGLAITPVAGVTYYIRVGGFAAGAGAGTLNIVEQTTALPNDECLGALAVGGGVTLTDTSLATTSLEPWSCSATTNFNHGKDLWFSYVPTSSGDFTINTCNAGTTIDTVLEVFTGSCGALTVVGCNDDVPCTFASFRSAVTLCGIAGTTYTFRIGSYGAGASGPVEFDIAEAPPAQNCVTTTYAANNGGAVGGMVYFDATFSSDVVIGGFDTNTSVATGTPINAEVYVTPGTYVGVTGVPASWNLVATGSGVAAGTNLPSHISTAGPIVLAAGSYGIAILALDFNHRYTTGGVGFPLTYASPDGVISLTLGAGSNAPFSASPFSPRVWNGTLCHDVNIGSVYCNSNTNSTGAVGQLLVGGSECVAVDALVLTATNLPNNAFGFFLCSDTPGMSTPPNSMGVLCLGGSIGRGVAGGVHNTGTTGVIRGESTLTLPHPSLGSVQVMAGETWHYQGWYRDAIGGVATSNLTDAVSLTYH